MGTVLEISADPSIAAFTTHPGPVQGWCPCRALCWFPQLGAEWVGREGRSGEQRSSLKRLFTHLDELMGKNRGRQINIIVSCQAGGDKRSRASLVMVGNGSISRAGKSWRAEGKRGRVHGRACAHTCVGVQPRAWGLLLGAPTASSPMSLLLLPAPCLGWWFLRSSLAPGSPPCPSWHSGWMGNTGSPKDAQVMPQLWLLRCQPWGGCPRGLSVSPHIPLSIPPHPLGTRPLP